MTTPLKTFQSDVGNSLSEPPSKFRRLTASNIFGGTVNEKGKIYTHSENNRHSNRHTHRHTEIKT